MKTLPSQTTLPPHASSIIREQPRDKDLVPFSTTTAKALPEWLRIKEAVAYSRLSKTKLFDLIKRGLIKSVSLKERGMVRGSRIVSGDSLRAFLEKHASGGEVSSGEQGEADPRAPSGSSRATTRKQPRARPNQEERSSNKHGQKTQVTRLRAGAHKQNPPSQTSNKK